LFSASDDAAVRTALEGAGLEFTERPTAGHVRRPTRPSGQRSAGSSPTRAWTSRVCGKCRSAKVRWSSRSPSTSPTRRGRHSATRLSA